MADAKVGAEGGEWEFGAGPAVGMQGAEPSVRGLGGRAP